ncbi:MULTISPECIES: hypothetical protein [unclassified Oleiphilus]|uniref:hypothetical protein n=1 Tax=unclassified Oleiphilus TaxID=2631174 RepID=UPI0007C3AF5C|nr:MULTISPECIES: hypothetical protein [unclassified Oleiphilus]KZZ36832.1 hypothetical protein A3757_13030 [Oleiphilus sp. HI0117]KZZ53937.1 hypothetical protein A3761_15605 [Oleiphilus sp. HI0123]KZZ60618.1 hypothetical protein A3761_22320 [Oleiphilus sp. HI0123]
MKNTTILLTSLTVIVIGGLLYLSLPGTDTKIKDTGTSGAEKHQILSALDRSNIGIESALPDKPPVKNSDTLLTTLQKEKYSNLPDERRTEMLEVISATNQARNTVSSGAEKYFDLVEDDKKFVELDALADQKIIELNRLLKEKQTSAD